MSFFGSFGKKAVEKVYDLASRVEGGRDYVATATNSVNFFVKGKDPRVYLKPGNIVQFFSRASGRTIQIVMGQGGSDLICDAIGGTGSYYPNAHWLVVVTPTGHYFFHNNYNYVAIKNGRIVIIPSSPSERPPNEAQFRVQAVLGSGQAIHLESVHMPGYCLSFDDEGQPAEEFKLKTKERFSQFEIHPIAYGPGIQPERDDKTIETSDELAPPSYWAATASSNTQSHTGSLSNSNAS